MEVGVFGNDLNTDAVWNAKEPTLLKGHECRTLQPFCDVSMNNNSRKGQKGTNRQNVNTL